MICSSNKEFSTKRAAIVRAACKKFPDTAARTLARKLVNEHPRIFDDMEQARRLVRYQFGVVGKHDQKRAADKSLFRAKRKPGQLPPLPKSLAKPWEPFAVEGCRKVLVLSDIHCPFHDERAIELALAYGETYNPDTILINGDLLDFQGISRFIRDPRGPTVKEELDICAELMRHVRARFPKARIVFKKGNHDERWEHMLWVKAPEILDCVEFSWHALAGFGECNVEVVGEQRPVMLGKLMVLHGHEKGRSAFSPVNPARGAFLRLLTSVLEGHSHRQSEHTERTADKRIITCRSTGALCDMSPDYAKFNKWSSGFATVDVDKTGEYRVELKNIIEGAVY